MRHLQICFLTLLAIIMTGCASSSAIYYPPTKYNVQEDKRIFIEFEKFWDLYVEKISKSFFVINNIEKQSRIINISFLANQPSDYADCGRAERTLDKTRFRYIAADSSSYYKGYQAGVDGTKILRMRKIDRDTTLEGRVNIFMAPDGPRTLLKVNVRYVWTVNIYEQHINSLTRSPTGRSSRSSHKVVFSTSETGSTSVAGDGFLLTCVSNGRLESRLLNLVSG